MKKLFNSFIEKIKQLDKGTIARTILLVLSWVNQIVALIGSTSFASQLWYQIVSAIITLLVSGVNYWYNNDWTNGALLARDFFDMLKDGKITEEEAKAFIEKHGDNGKSESVKKSGK